MTDSIPVYQVPGVVTTIDTATGRETHGREAWRVMPPPPDACQICAHKHEPHLPHNAQSIFYQTVFNGMVGRPPTWADAVAHCGPGMRRLWMEELKRRGVWSEPPAGEKPVAHHGVEA